MNDFCKCKEITGTHVGYEDDWGYWDICDKCNKKIEDGYHYCNHFDGEDHDDIDILQ